ncbi:MAG: ComEA family DNA-binding protein [Acidobacteriota bacterium]
MRQHTLVRTLTVGIFLFLLAALPLQAEDGKVDLNIATLRELDTLPGVGPIMAARILDFRIKNGPFKRIEDLMNVRGIGEKKFLKMKSRIAVAAPAQPQSRSASRPRQSP